MRNKVLSTMMVLAVVVAACGGEEVSAPSTTEQEPVTITTVETPTTTQAPTTTTTVPVTTTTQAPTTTTTMADQEDNDLPYVTFYDKGLSAEHAQILRDGVSAAWTMLKPYAQEQGLKEFPKSEIWGFPNEASVVRYCGHRDGCAYPGRAYTSITSIYSVSEVSHEAMHLVQFAIGGSSLESYCIAEGAAQYYGYRSVEGHPGHQVPFNVIMNDMKTTMAQQGKLPALGRLETWNQFKSVQSTIAYPTCLIAFDMLMQVEGGEEEGSKAYFNYLAELRNTDWRTAFNKSFKDDVSTFEKRFDFYRENGFKRYIFPEEIKQAERDAYLEYVSDCLQRRNHNKPCPV